jgi:prepilin-type N-terminal cleavage/methylation domain-containing protein
MHLPSCCRPARQAFTLVELAIVLVIIGLIVGGILVGQDLIANASVKGTLEQLKKVNAGATTFRTRFYASPGDITPTRADSYGLTTRAGTTGAGDGNGILQNGSVTAEQQGLGHETALFWVDLSSAKYIPDTFVTATDAAAASLAIGDVKDWLPLLKLQAGSSGFMHVYSVSGRNYFYLGNFSATPTDANGVLDIAASITPINAHLMDEKIDDALGNSGAMTSIDDLTNNGIDTGTGTAADCLNADGSYNLDGSDGNAQNCMISSRAEF